MHNTIQLQGRLRKEFYLNATAQNLSNLYQYMELLPTMKLELLSYGRVSESFKLLSYVCLIILTRWVRSWGCLPIWDWLIAAYYYSEKCYRKSLFYYKKGINKNPNHRATNSARLDAAYCMLKLGQLDRAYQELSFLVHEPNVGKDTFLLYLRVLRYLGKKDKAIQVGCLVYEHIKHDPLVVAANAHSLLWAMDNNKQKAKVIRKSLFVARSKVSIGSREDYVIQTALAHFEMRYGDPTKAHRMFSRILFSGKAPYEAVVLKGFALLAESKSELARHQFVRAVSVRHEDPEPWIGIAKSYLASSSEESLLFAIQAAQKACSLSSYQNLEALNILAFSLRMGGKELDAELYQARINALKGRQYSDSLKALQG